MKCFTTMKYSFLVNGETTEITTPDHGLRQGDPLSPDIFLLCAEGLGALIKKNPTTTI